ncbi:MAG: SIS domain-containing protein [Nostocoides sp.]
MLDPDRLDDLPAIERVDQRATLRVLAGAGADVRRTALIADESGIERLGISEHPRALLVAGVGSAGMVGDLVRFLADESSPVAVTTRANVPLPGWVGPLDLVTAVSSSGAAPGPVALAAEAGRRGAGLLTVGAADSPLAQVSARYRGVHIDSTARTQAARTSLWALVAPVLLGLAQAQVIGAVAEDLAEMADTLDAQAEACRPASESFVNPAKDLAISMAERVPVVLGDGGLTGVVAARAASVLARTARIPATWGALPDAASQVVACFDGPYATSGGQLAAENIFADPYLDGPPHPRLGLLMVRDVLPDPMEPTAADRHNLAQAVLDSAAEAGVTVWERQAAQGSPLARMAGLVALCDFTAAYLAIGLGEDPAGSRHVAALRDRTR